MSVRTESAYARTKSTKITAIRGTTLSRPLSVARNHINTLRRVRMLQLSKISQRVANDNPVEAVVDEDQEVAEQLGEQIHGSPLDARQG
jgi:hypothetical protein